MGQDVHCRMCREEELRILFEEDEEIDLEAIIAAVFEDVEHFNENLLSCPWLHDLQLLLIRLLREEEAEESVPVLQNRRGRSVFTSKKEVVVPHEKRTWSVSSCILFEFDAYTVVFEGRRVR